MKQWPGSTQLKEELEVVHPDTLELLREVSELRVQLSSTTFGLQGAWLLFSVETVARSNMKHTQRNKQRAKRTLNHWCRYVNLEQRSSFVPALLCPCHPLQRYMKWFQGRSGTRHTHTHAPAGANALIFRKNRQVITKAIQEPKKPERPGDLERTLDAGMSSSVGVPCSRS